jgi:molybdate transport system substrate-binding protein
VRVTAAGSNALANQVLAGVPGDIFLSANPAWADTVDQAGLALARRPLLTNRLVLVTPTGNPAQVHSPTDLTEPAVRRVALAGEMVPAGIYARQALSAASVYDGLVASERIARGQDVRMTLTYIETGEADAGVVYATDARASQRVEVVYTFDPATHDPIIYPAVLLKHAADDPGAERFFAFLASPQAMAVFERHGFLPAVEEGEP